MIRNLFQYLNDRFPLQQYIPLALLMFTSIFAYCGILDGRGASFTISEITIGGFFIVVLTFFLLRLFDELKDWKDDIENFPERPISKGIVSIKSIRIISIITIIAVFVIDYFLMTGLKFDFIYLILWAWLMRVEFYCSSFLRKHIFLYLVTHHFVMSLADFFIIRVYCVSRNMSFIPLYLVIIIIFTCYTLTLELSRKIWDEKYEIENYMTYSKAIGMHKAVNLVLLFSVISFVINVVLVFTFFAAKTFALIGITFLVIQTAFMMKVFKFKKKSSELKHYYLRDMAAIYVFLSMLVINIFYFL